MGTQAPVEQNYDRQRSMDKIQKQKEIDDWLPITSARNARWWYSTFHNVTAMVGAGVLGLPYAMSELGWGPGVAILVLSWIITLYTLWQMVEMHEMVPGRRFDRYHELGQYAFGEKLGLYIVVPQQLVVEVGVNIVYMVTGGKSLQKFHDTVCSTCKPLKTTYFIMIFASVHFVLSHLPNFNSISGVSLAAAVMSLSYSTIAWVASAHKGVVLDVQYTYKSKTTAGKVFDFFSALGDVAFAYAGHNVVLEIQATIPSTPEKPSKGPMWRGVVVAYIIVALCYFPVAFVGYWIFGNSVDDNILMSLKKPAWLIAMANMFVVIHVIGSYQIYAMPVFDMIETVLVKKLHLRPSWTLRFVTRNIYVGKETFRLYIHPISSNRLLTLRLKELLMLNCSVHYVCCHHLPILRRSLILLRRICICSDDVLSSLHYVAGHIQTEEIQPVLVGELVLHRSRSPVDGAVTDRRIEANHSSGEDLLVLLLRSTLQIQTTIPRDILFSFSHIGLLRIVCIRYSFVSKPYTPSSWRRRIQCFPCQKKKKRTGYFRYE